MAKKREAGILLETRYDKSIQKLEPDQAGLLLQAVYDYRLRGETSVELGPAADVLFGLMCEDIDANTEQYARACERSKAAADKRWKHAAPDGMPTDADACDRMPTHADASDRMPPHATACHRMPTDTNDSAECDRIKTMPIEQKGIEGNGIEGKEKISPLTPLPGESDPEPSPADSKPEPKKAKPPDILTKSQRERFDRWYAEYPKKVGKADAQRAWKKLAPDDELTDRMIRAVHDARSRDDRFTRDGGRYIPNPATWLNRREWENEYDAPPSAHNRRIHDDNRADWDAIAAEYEQNRAGDA